MPVVWYIVGASGSGKSTRAAELVADLAPAVRVVSTDVIRAQLRAVLDRDEHPDLWAESFNVPVRPGDTLVDAADGSQVNIDGFLRQCRPVLRCVEAAVDYCLTEGWSCVVEGVHLVPGEFDLVQPDRADVRAELRLVGDEAGHRALFTAREHASGGGRAAGHYHDHLPRIRVVQELLERRWAAWQPSVAATREVVQVAPRP